MFFKTNSKRSSHQVKITTDDLLNLLNYTNSSFANIYNCIESEIFSGSIIDNDCPIEYQKEEVEIMENFKIRYYITSEITGLAIIEYVVNENFGVGVFEHEFKEFKKIVFQNLLKQREKILNPLDCGYFFDDDGENFKLGLEYAEEQFCISVTQKVNDINNLFYNKGHYSNLYYHYMTNIGLVIPVRGQNSVNLDSKIKSSIDVKLFEIRNFLQSYFDSL